MRSSSCSRKRRFSLYNRFARVNITMRLTKVKCFANYFLTDDIGFTDRENSGDQAFSLHYDHPSPLNPMTTMRGEVAFAAHGKLTMFNSPQGKRVSLLASRAFSMVSCHRWKETPRRSEGLAEADIQFLEFREVFLRYPVPRHDKAHLNSCPE